MKALTLTQPWATLVAIGAKKIETRGWKTGYRGPLAIHAALGFKRKHLLLAHSEPIISVLQAAGWGRSFLTFARGVVVATCELVACQKIYQVDDGYTVGSASWPLDDQERAFGDYTPGRYAWLLANIVKLPEPVPARGSLGLWDWNP